MSHGILGAAATDQGFGIRPTGLRQGSSSEIFRHIRPAPVVLNKLQSNRGEVVRLQLLMHKVAGILTSSAFFSRRDMVEIATLMVYTGRLELAALPQRVETVDLRLPKWMQNHRKHNPRWTVSQAAVFLDDPSTMVRS